ncbi:MAG: radical SAM protein [Bacteroides sp.]
MQEQTAKLLSHCELCFHACGTDRIAGHRGICHLDAGLYVASVCRHLGEEPALGGEKGVCNVFFNHCNLQCKFCQNWQISTNTGALSEASVTLQGLLESIVHELEAGCTALGFVSPTPYVPHIIECVAQLHKRDYYPTVIYNTNAFDTPETIALLEGVVDVYLPDYKYGNEELGRRYSGIKEYPEQALTSIAAMIKQVGKELEYSEEGLVRRGVIVRHLVLPNQVENSRAALFNLWSEFGNKLTLSLMSQYTPLHLAGEDSDLSRKITEEEYRQVVDFMYSLGYTNGWVQEMSSIGTYVPNFGQENPFL